jgi:ribulose-5-phosphate 4-epimerase/fuculose-1-phosphate aldolase
MHILIVIGGGMTSNVIRRGNCLYANRFPTQIARAALTKNHKVTYLHPHDTAGVYKDSRLQPITYQTRNDYTQKLESILKNAAVDVVFFYGGDFYSQNKQDKKQSVRAKLPHSAQFSQSISSAKQWAGTALFQVELVSSPHRAGKKLVDAIYKSNIEHRSDLAIVTNFSKTKPGAQSVIVVASEKGVILLNGTRIAEKVVSFVEKRAQASHFKTVALHTATNKKYGNTIQLFKKLCGRLSKRNLMPAFFAGATSGHGSLALRTTGESFLITARGSNKKNMRPEDIVVVQKVDWKKREVVIELMKGKKASFNAVLVAALFARFPKINAVVHTHSFARNAPTTKFPYAPGSLEYATIPVRLFTDDVRVINLKHHGLIAIGSDLTETTNYVLEKCI